MANTTANKTDNKPVEVKEKLVKFTINKTRELQDDVFVSVNDRTWQIQRGVEVEVPECVLEVLRHQAEMENIALAYEAAASSPKNH